MVIDLGSPGDRAWVLLTLFLENGTSIVPRQHQHPLEVGGLVEAQIIAVEPRGIPGIQVVRTGSKFAAGSRQEQVKIVYPFTAKAENGYTGKP